MNFPPHTAWLDSAPPCWDMDSFRDRVTPTFVSCHFLQASPILEMPCFKLYEIHFIRFNKNSSAQDSDFGLGHQNVSSFEPHLSGCVHKTGPLLLNVELTAPLTNETRHLYWIWFHSYTQARGTSSVCRAEARVSAHRAVSAVLL